MIGSIRWNLIVGAFAFVLTFALSMKNNILLTSLLRGIYSFAILFALVFLCRWLLGTLAGLQPFSHSDSADGEDNGSLGTAYDAVTPADQDEELHRMLKESLNTTEAEEEDLFAPLNPPKLSTKIGGTPEDWAQGVRRMSEE